MRWVTSSYRMSMVGELNPSIPGEQSSPRASAVTDAHTLANSSAVHVECCFILDVHRTRAVPYCALQTREYMGQHARHAHVKFPAGCMAWPNNRISVPSAQQRRAHAFFYAHFTVSMCRPAVYMIIVMALLTLHMHIPAISPTSG